MSNLFLTGDISIGKTTILKETLKRIDGRVGGYTTKRVIDGPFRTYVATSLYDQERECTIAKVDSRDWSKEVFKEAFSTDLLSILEDSFQNRDLIVLDELGSLENHIDCFTSKVYELLDSDKIVFGVLKVYDCEFLNTIRARDDVIIIKISKDNRDDILKDILQILKSFKVAIKEI